MDEELIERAMALRDTPTGIDSLEKIYAADRPPYYRFLFWLGYLSQNQSLSYVELGVNSGGSLAHFSARTHRFSTCIGIDTNIDRAVHCPKARLIQGDSRTPEIVTQFGDKSIDILFIDTDHTYESLRLETTLWLPKVKSSGVVFFDDIATDMFSCGRAFDELPYKKRNLAELHFTGFGMIFKKDTL